MNESNYSLLLHNISSEIGQGLGTHIQDNLGLNTSKTTSSLQFSPPSSAANKKRSRVPFANASSPPESSSAKKTSLLMPMTAYLETTVARAEAELDELRLENEQMTDRMTTLRDEFERYKEKSARQLCFLESDNAQLKQSATGKIERYYEEKKKWQAKLRAAEAAAAAAAAASSSAASASSSSSSSSSSGAAAAKAAEDKWKIRFEDLERSVQAKSDEARQLGILNADLEQKVRQLEQQSLPSRLNLAQDVVGDAQETKELRKRYVDVESTLRRKSRELERLEQKMQNQSLLQEANAALSSKVAAMQEIVDSAQATRTKCQVLLEEKKTWSMIFRDVCQSSSLADYNAASEEDATPVAALRLLSAAQQKCTLLLKTQGELEAGKTDMKRQLLRAEALQHESERGKADALFRADTAEDKLRLAQQQVRLFEGEVKSLRAMIKTFDAEFSIGRPEAEKVLKIKEDATTSINSELDACRIQAQAFATKVGELEEKLAASSADAMELRRLTERLREELYGLKHCTGVDFVRGKTKVLHFVNNPSAERCMSRPAVSSIPSEKMTALRVENKQLSEALQALASALAAQAGSAQSAPQNLSGDQSVMNVTAGGGAHGGAPLVSAAAGGPDSSKLNLRLKEMFRERITSFREAVYLLTGYKVCCVRKFKIHHHTSH